MKGILRCLQKLKAMVVIAGVCALAPLSPLQAQTGESQLSQKEIVTADLQPFAQAYKEVSQIHAAYTERILQADDPAKTEKLQEEANQKMHQAVENRGLTIGDYNTMFQTIQNDPALKEEFRTVLNQTP